MVYRRTAVNPQLLAIMCIAVTGVILSLGLWPFHVPANDVKWLPAREGIRLGRFGSVTAAAPMTGLAGGNQQAGSVEVWLQPARRWGSGTFLSFAQPDQAVGLRMYQSLTDLAIEAPSSDKPRRLYVDEIFRPPKPRFITVTLGPSGTVVYVDGVPARAVRTFRYSPRDFSGRLILGDEPGQSDSWAGTFLGVAFYGEELTPAEVQTHYRTWTAGGRPQIAAPERCTALYLFNERSGSVIHSRIGFGNELRIPADYGVVDQIFLEPFWKEFSMSTSYWAAVFKNVIGFLPVGFVFYAYLAGVRGIRRPVLFTVLLGFLISLTIEVTQWFLPMRDSGTSDLITNTLGTWLGVVLYRWFHQALAHIFWWLPIFPEPRG
jgi:hypothetical protein